MPKIWLLFLSSMATSINMFGLPARRAGERGTNRVGSALSHAVLARVSLGLGAGRARFWGNGAFKDQGKLSTFQILYLLTQVCWNVNVVLQVWRRALMAWQAWIGSVANVNRSSGSACRVSASIALKQRPMTCTQRDELIMLWIQCTW